MKRAFILILDSFGVGAAPDADKFGDVSANTLRHIAEVCAEGRADIPGVRNGALNIPNLVRLGLNAISTQITNMPLPGIDTSIEPSAGIYGFAAEISADKDTPSGHWEITGVPVLNKWGHFKDEDPCFPTELIQQFIDEAQLPGILGNCHASGTTIINEFGDESIATGKPIVYTSADSVFQIAADENSFGLDKLYQCCEIARRLVNPYRICRVIARPFKAISNQYARTDDRRDYSIPPLDKTLLDYLIEAGGSVIAIGKVADIFANHGISKKVPAYGNMNIFDATLQQTFNAKDNSIIFSNFVDFDMLYGHRRDIAGYARALEMFDKRIPELEKILKPGDIVIISADHGCDPTQHGSDHTREYIPILAFGPGIKTQSIGKRNTFADIGQSLATHFGLYPLKYGTSFL